MEKALIIIDLQKGFINRLTNELPKKVYGFIKKNRKKYGLILFTQYVNHPRSHFAKNMRWYGFMKKSEYDLVDEIKEFASNKNLFIKDTYGSFVDGKMLKVLRKNKITAVDLAGVDTENCVLTFARDAFDRGYKVRVFRNLCASHSDPKLHRAALKIIADNIGSVIS